MRAPDVRSPVIASLVTLLLVACAEPVELTLPSAEDVATYYESEAAMEVEIRGNVVAITVDQSAAQLRRGGTLWAKVGPFVYLFTEETRQLFEDYPGLGGVRVETRTPGGTDVATALLARNELTGVLWRRALNIAGQARRDGTKRISLMEDLIRWGEDHTEYEYNAQYIRRR